MPKTVTPMMISFLKSRTTFDTASKSGSSKSSIYSLLAANAKPLESAKLSSRFWMRPEGNGESDTWIGRAMTWFAPLPTTWNSEKGKSGRKIDRRRREFLAHDVAQLAGDPRHFGAREARARGGDELNLAVLRRGAHGQFPAGCAREYRKFERGAHLAMQRMVCGGNFPGSGIRIVMGSHIRQQRRFGGGAVGQDDGGRGKLQLHAAARFL